MQRYQKFWQFAKSFTMKNSISKEKYVYGETEFGRIVWSILLKIIAKRMIR